jgi:TonB dependent receptor/Carboxypeptidase regulatory-like domain
MFSLKTAIALILLALIAPASVVWAQAATGEVNGTVSDETGSLVPGATVRLINQATQVGSQTVTNARGHFVFVNVKPATYVLSIELEGFKKVQTAPFDLGVNQAVTQAMKLSLGSVSETVEVAGEAEMLQQSSSELGTVITAKAVHELPLNGRNFTQLLTLTPGATPVSTAQGSGVGFQDAGISAIPGSAFSKPALHGQQNRSTLYFLDGIINTDLRGPVYGFLPIVDLTDEFKVQSHNDKAEYGGVVGGIVNMTSKSGANELHGSAWEFLRDDRFDARNPFTDFDPITKAPKIAQFRQNEFGATLSGPIVRNRTFFSVGYEGWRYQKPNQNLTYVPTPEELSGDFTRSLINQNIFNPYSTRRVGTGFVRDRFMCDAAGRPLPTNAQGLQPAGVPCNKIPSSLISPQMQGFLSAYLQRPNYSSATDPAHNFLDNRLQTDDNDAFQVKVDHHFASGDSAFVRFSRMAVTHIDAVQGTNELTPSRYHAHNYGGGLVHLFSPNLILDVSGGVMSKPYVFNQAQSDAGTEPINSLGFRDTDRFGGLVTNLATPWLTNDIGNRGDSPRDNTDWSITGNLSWLKGNHNFKAGYQYIHVIRLQTNTFQTFGFSNTQTADPTNTARTGASLASALLGLPSGFSGQVPDIGAVHFKMATWSTYLQDEWKLNSSLTLNLGLRWDVLTQPEVIGDRLSNALDLDRKLLLIGASSISSCSQTQQVPCIPGNGLASVPFSDHIQFVGKKAFMPKPVYDNVGPRVGLAWRINPATVLRAGYGLYWDALPARSQYTQNDIEAAGWPWTTSFAAPPGTNAIGQPLLTMNNVVGSFPFPTAPAHPWGTGGFYDDPNFKDAYSHQWNAELQRQFGRNLMVAVAYVGSKSGRQPYSGRGNAASQASPNGTPLAQIDALRAIPWMTSGLNYSRSIGEASYNGLEVKVQRRFARGLQSLLAYTWSKCLDTSSGWFGAENGPAPSVGGSAVQNYFDLNSNRSVCAYDIPHFLSWFTIYELPAGKGKGRLERGPASWFLGNWQVSYIFQARSGQPFNLGVNAGDVANIGGSVINAAGVAVPNPVTGYARPNLVPGANPIPEHRTLTMWYDPSAFSIPSGSFGNFGRNVLRSRSVWNLDFSLFKNFPIGDREARTIQLRFDAFNVFNHINWGIPGSTIGQAGAGVITALATGTSPRQLQFALKFAY